MLKGIDAFRKWQGFLRIMMSWCHDGVEATLDLNSVNRNSIDDGFELVPDGGYGKVALGISPGVQSHM
jgi:hypothetical protein